MAHLQLRWHWIGIAALLIAPSFGPAHAAPQALALLETDTSTPLVCESGSCKAEFSTFCLQKERPLPDANAPYTVASGDNLHLVLTAPNGTVRRMQAADLVRVYSARGGYTAVVIELPRSTLDALGASHAAIEVGEKVTLIPVAFAQDVDPQTEQDRLLATGPLRELGAQLVDRSPSVLAAIHALNRLVNALPERNGIEPGTRARLWKDAVTQGFAAAPLVKISRAAREYESCWRDPVVGLGGMSVRTCLQNSHDGLMWKHTKRYWNAVGAGT